MSQIIGNSPVEDKRNPVDRLRRWQLQRILKAHGYKDVNFPATALVEQVRSLGINVLTFDYSQRIREEEPETVTIDANELDVVVEYPDYKSMKMPEVRKLCKEKGISYAPTDKKADLIEKLDGQNAA